MLLKRNTSLASRLPQDVRERLRKAGIDDIEWYAGRMDAEGPTVSKMPQARERWLRQRASVKRREGRKTVARTVVRKMTGWARRSHSSSPRHARP
jgi:hypothetical protein